MHKKSKLRKRIEALEIAASITLRGVRAGTPDYTLANNHVQRVRLASTGEKTFRLQQRYSTTSTPSLVITRLT